MRNKKIKLILSAAILTGITIPSVFVLNDKNTQNTNNVIGQKNKLNNSNDPIEPDIKIGDFTFTCSFDPNDSQGLIIQSIKVAPTKPTTLDIPEIIEAFGSKYWITEIGNEVFKSLDQTLLQGVTFKNATHLRKIGTEAFCGNFDLTKIPLVFPETLEEIGVGGFAGCFCKYVIFKGKTPPTFNENWSLQIDKTKGHRVCLPYSKDKRYVNAYLEAPNFRYIKSDVMNGEFPESFGIGITKDDGQIASSTAIVVGQSVNLSTELFPIALVDPELPITWRCEPEGSVSFSKNPCPADELNAATLLKPVSAKIYASFYDLQSTSNVNIYTLSLNVETPVDRTIKAAATGIEPLSFTTTIFDPSDIIVEKTIDYSIVKDDGTEWTDKPSWLNISSDGKIDLNNLPKKSSTDVDVYSFKVKAKLTSESLKKDPVISYSNVYTLTVDFASVVSLNISKPSDLPVGNITKGHPFDTSPFTSTVVPAEAKQKVIWSIKPSDSYSVLEGLSIDPTSGVLSWNGKGTPGTYKFKIVGTTDGFQSNGQRLEKETDELTLNVIYDTPTSVSITNSPTTTGRGLSSSWGRANDTYTAVVESQEHVAQDVTWSLFDFKKDDMTANVPSWLHISQGGELVPQISNDPLPSGLIYWDNSVTDGTYKVRVKATSVANRNVFTTSNEYYNFVIDNATATEVTIDESAYWWNENGVVGVEGSQSTSTWLLATTKYNNGTSDVDSALWSIEDLTKDGEPIASVPSWLSIQTLSTGHTSIKWSKNSEAGTYRFKLKASAAKLPSVSKKTTNEITLKIQYADISNVVVNESQVCEQYVTSTSQSGEFNLPFTATINTDTTGGITDSRVKWSLEMENKSVSPNWLKIDENGLVKWDANSTVGVYSFKVVAVSIGVNSSGRSVIGKSTKTFTLSVEYDQTDSIDISGSSEIKSDFGKSSKSDKYTSTVHSSGLANPNVKWILEMEDNKGVPQWIKLEANESSEDKNAYILWEESLPEGQYKLVLKAYSLQKGSETVFGKINITLTITKPNESNKNKIILWSIVAASAVVALGILTFIIIKVHKNKKNKTGLKK